MRVVFYTYYCFSYSCYVRDVDFYMQDFSFYSSFDFVSFEDCNYF